MTQFDTEQAHREDYQNPKKKTRYRDLTPVPAGVLSNALARVAGGCSLGRRLIRLR